MIIKLSSLSFAFQSPKQTPTTDKDAEATHIPSPPLKLKLREEDAAPQPWDPSDPNNMHAIPLSEVPDKWRPKMVGNDIEDKYKDVIILVAAVFLAGALVIIGAAIVRCLYNHECFWQSEGCCAERRKRKEAKRREQRRLKEDRKRISWLSTTHSYREYV
ncbi:hypothetical protein DM02DRAFT_624689 [Periconia macrospinosa]|uniref:Uncharacterized protein n=1 Tax=Periconia macrospinosa TaxID=97972 RepID=A0A2V1E394_9PLEO|nr:hypothetical protein DM02DRAFT_624689 [Periconia macrospinosa]